MNPPLNLLLVCNHDPQSNAIGAVRVRKFAEDLAAAGCSVRVLTMAGLTSYSTGVQHHEGLVPLLRLATPQSGSLVSMRRTWTTYRRARTSMRALQLWRRVRPVFAWVYRHIVAIPESEIFSVRTLFRHSRKLGAWTPDVVVASGPPFSSFFVARRLARKRSIPWVADYRDLWTLSSYYLLGPVRRRIDGALEARLLRSASMVTTVSEPLADEMRHAFERPSEVVLNGYDPGDLARLAPACDVKSGLPLRIVYTGEIYEGKRDPEPLFMALASMGLDSEEVLVEFHGDTVDLVEEAAQRQGVDHLIRCGPRIPHVESVAFQQRADVLLLLMWNDPGERGVYTGKVFEYLGSRRPILMLGFAGGVAADLIRSRDAGVIANEPDDIAVAVRRWLAVKEGAGAVPPLPESVSAGLTRQEQSKRLRALCESLISNTSRGAVL